MLHKMVVLCNLAPEFPGRVGEIERGWGLRTGMLPKLRRVISPGQPPCRKMACGAAGNATLLAALHYAEAYAEQLFSDEYPHQCNIIAKIYYIYPM